MSDKTPLKIQFRLPPELHQRLVEAAALDDRSMNSEVVRRIERSFTFEKVELAYQERVERLRAELGRAHELLMTSNEKYAEQHRQHQEFVKAAWAKINAREEAARAAYSNPFPVIDDTPPKTPRAKSRKKVGD